MYRLEVTRRVLIAILLTSLDVEQEAVVIAFFGRRIDDFIAAICRRFRFAL